MKKRSALISGALVTGGMVAGSIFAPLGLASAQTDDEPTTPDSTENTESEAGERGQKGEALAEFLGLTVDDLKAARDNDQTLAEIAADAGVSEADLTDFLVTQRTERIEAAVEAGRLTDEQATEKLDGLADKVTEKVNTPPSEREGRGGHRRGARTNALEVLESFGVSTDDVQAGREAGQSVAEIAAAAGVSEADLVDALVADATARVDAKVEEGSIDADRAAEITDGLDDRITERVNQDPSERSARGERRGGGDRGQNGETGLDT